MSRVKLSYGWVLTIRRFEMSMHLLEVGTRKSDFRESLPNLLAVWKDATQNIIQAGDHNCTQRYADSDNIAWQKHHVQPGLLAQMECFGLRDELINIKGNDVQGIVSRVTNGSKTRIDFI